MFGISFQLPMIMLFLERISVFNVTDYREKRRMAILVIAFLSMIMTPADPMSMLMMMFPLVLLYEFGIGLCVFRPSRSDSDLEPV
jgi:sec-independent protein translocase protein TatC